MLKKKCVSSNTVPKALQQNIPQGQRLQVSLFSKRCFLRILVCTRDFLRNEKILTVSPEADILSMYVRECIFEWMNSSGTSLRSISLFFASVALLDLMLFLFKKQGTTSSIYMEIINVLVTFAGGQSNKTEAQIGQRSSGKSTVVLTPSHSFPSETMTWANLPHCRWEFSSFSFSFLGQRHKNKLSKWIKCLSSTCQHSC